MIVKKEGQIFFFAQKQNKNYSTNGNCQIKSQLKVIKTQQCDNVKTQCHLMTFYFQSAYPLSAVNLA